MMPEPETYAEYLWRERTESGGEVDKTLSNVTEEPLTSEILSKGCDHLWLNKAGADYRSNPVEVCAKCGEER